MGTIYCGPYAEEIGSNRHEGHAARIRPDGTETATLTWSSIARAFTGYRAHCACNWRGTATYPPTEHGENLAIAEWDREHLQPIIDAEADRHTIPARTLVAFARELRENAARARDKTGHEDLTMHGRGTIDAADRLEQLLDDLAHPGGTA